ncbi:hypothetical protein XELAEV_18000913mg [Xenopus laevis]|nr:hypothetical protein XELAEV_18000913mg [Xenopus laevis]
MVWFPRLLYPLHMLPVLLSRTDLTKLNQAVSQFVWGGKHPRIGRKKTSAIKSIWGDWVHNRELYAVPQLEQALVPDLSLVSLLHLTKSQLPSQVKDNPLLHITIRAWWMARRRLSLSASDSLFQPFVSNPHFLNNYRGRPFLVWAAQGVTQVRHLLRTPDTFYTLHYAQSVVRTLSTQDHNNPIDSILCSNTVKPSISLLYKILRTSLPEMEFLRGIGRWTHQIPELSKDKLLSLHVKSLALLRSSQFHEMFFKILHRGYFSPELRKKVGWSDTDCCLKCSAPGADIYHCLWTCPQQFWNEVLLYCKTNLLINIPLTYYLLLLLTCIYIAPTYCVAL